VNIKKAEKIVKDLGRLVGPEKVIIDKDILKEDLVNYIGYVKNEVYKKLYLDPMPICVVKPDNEVEVSKVLSYLNENRINCVPKTGRSGCTAGGVPGDDVTVIVDGSGMNKIIKFDDENMQVTVQCGTPIEYLENFCNKKGYTTGHFPQSLPLAHIGGLIATRSIGQFSTLYGGIEDLVVGLKVVMPDGRKIRIKNVPRRAAGPDIRQLFIGSEGALAFITEATLKIFKFDVKNRWMNAYAVKDMDTGLKILQEIMTNGYKPAVARLHDDVEAKGDPHNKAVGYSRFVRPGESILLFIADGPEDITSVTGKAIDKFAKKAGARDVGKKPLELWLIHRNDSNKTLLDNEELRNDCVRDTIEVAANWTEIGQIYKNVCKRIADENFPGLVRFSGHSSHSYINGTNIYFMFAFKAEKDPKETRDKYFRFIGMIFEEVLSLGGTIAHHHGIGKHRVPWIKDEHGSAYILLKMIKDAMDPNKIMNKGTLFVE